MLFAKNHYVFIHFQTTAFPIEFSPTASHIELVYWANVIIVLIDSEKSQKIRNNFEWCLI